MNSMFNDERLLEPLSRMMAFQQLAFGAVCCERMLPGYEIFVREVGWRDAELLRTALDTVWEFVDGQGPSEDDIRGTLSRCEEFAPDSEDFTSLYTSPAQNAVFAICSLLDFLLDEDADRIASIARFSTDSVDLIVQEREAMDPRDPLRERKILEHSLMQQELLRQRRDLQDAGRLAPGDRGELLALRARAQRESNLLVFSGQPS